MLIALWINRASNLVNELQPRPIAEQLVAAKSWPLLRMAPVREDIEPAQKQAVGPTNFAGRETVMKRVSRMGDAHSTVCARFCYGVVYQPGPIQEKWRRPTPFALLLPRI